MNQKLNIAICAVSLFVVSILSAQEANETTTPSKDTVSTTLAQELNTKPGALTLDGGMVALTKSSEGKFQLNDLEAAAEYDRLWLKELYESAQLFSDMELEIQSPSMEEDNTG